MKFKDVAHLYVGCKGFCQIEPHNEIETMKGMCYDEIITNEDQYDVDDFKPLLYPLSVMDYVYMRKHMKNMLTVSDFKYLLDNHFDLFNLIESGEAIDVTTLEVNPYK